MKAICELFSELSSFFKQRIMLVSLCLFSWFVSCANAKDHLYKNEFYRSLLDNPETQTCDISKAQIEVKSDEILCNGEKYTRDSNSQINVIGLSTTNGIQLNNAGKVSLLLNSAQSESINVVETDLLLYFEGSSKILNRISLDENSKIEISNFTQNSNNKLLNEDSSKNSVLTVEKMDNNPEYSAIGGPCKSIVINNGKINAIGGIGSNAKLVTINNGEIFAKGVKDGEPGIGNCEQLIIDNGVIEATGGPNSAGIGSGNVEVSQIRIRGGKIYAFGGINASAIGSGSQKVNDIILTGGEIKATGGENGSGIGSGSNSNVSNLIITSVSIFSNGGENGAGIGTGSFSTVREITIYSGHIDSIGGLNAAGIGSGAAGSVSRISIKSGDISTRGSSNAAGIGSGAGILELSAHVDYVSITGGTITANGGDFAAGIGSGKGISEQSSTVIFVSIIGGEINGRGGKEAPGIGCGTSHGKLLHLSIKGGIVTAAPHSTTPSVKGIGDERLTLVEIAAEKPTDKDQYRCTKIISENGIIGKSVLIDSNTMEAHDSNAIIELNTQLSKKCAEQWKEEIDIPSDFLQTPTLTPGEGEGTPEATLQLHNLYVIIPLILGSFLVTGVVICIFLQIYLKKHAKAEKDGEYNSFHDRDFGNESAESEHVSEHEFKDSPPEGEL
ncbi:hypothetical protein TRFO_03902 [Tritrichomonas foetus]|uniref:Uncharacterized protein n=1 Tax=Tritrichomonas foetus TaxID=1144522 RepID=A0A1J4KPF7_9EUKA|nr:hypothetical protein TRFO_03902 [Tritrichomonas foetus]|eukprot:OHT11676.1 hypothetical protein TRFO_03902 [Tritrichomonas foetus]